MKCLLPFCCFLLASASIFGQRTLDFFVEKAFDNQPEIRSFDIQWRSLELENKKIIAENTRPKLWWSADIMVAPFFSNKIVEVTPNPSPRAVGFDPSISNGALYSGLINASLPIWNRRSFAPMLEATNIQERVLQNSVALKKRDIRKAVADQFANTLAAQEAIMVSDTILSLIDEQINIVQKLLQAGLASALDLDKLRVERASEYINSLLRTQNFRTSLLALNLLTGVSDTTFAQISLAMLPDLPKIEAAKVIFHEKFQLDSLLTENQVAVSETKYLPVFSLNSSAGLNAIELTSIHRREGFQAGVHFQKLIFDGHQRDITRSQAQIGLETIHFYRENFDRQRQIALAADRALAQSLGFVLKSYDAQAAEYRRLLDLTRRQAGRSEKVSLPDILNALRQSKQVQLDKISIQNQRRLLINDFNFWNE